MPGSAAVLSIAGQRKYKLNTRSLLIELYPLRQALRSILVLLFWRRLMGGETEPCLL